MPFYLILAYARYLKMIGLDLDERRDGISQPPYSGWQSRDIAIDYYERNL